MQPFQSKLFNWIYHSPPFRLGRKTRLFLQNCTAKISPQVKKLWEITIHGWRDQPHDQSTPGALGNKFSAPLSNPSRHIQPRPDVYPESITVRNPTDRIRRFLEVAFTYFFQRKKLPAAEQSDALTVFENDYGPWPFPPQLANPYIDNLLSPMLSQEMGMITPVDRAEEISQWISEEEEEENPLHAWIETHATSLGYTYGPIMDFLYRLDRWLAQLECCLGAFFRRVWHWLTTPYF